MNALVRFEAGVLDFSEVSSPEIEVRVQNQESGDQARFSALLDTGCSETLFRFDDLAALIEEPGEDEDPTVEVRGVSGARFDAYERTAILALGELEPIEAPILVTMEQIPQNLVGRDVLAAYLSAFDFQESRVLATPRDAAVIEIDR